MLALSLGVIGSTEDFDSSSMGSSPVGSAARWSNGRTKVCNTLGEGSILSCASLGL